MRIKNIGPIAGIAAGVIAIVVVFTVVLQEPPQDTMHFLDFSYDSNFHLKQLLQSEGILMSNPLELSGDAVLEHCRFFDDDSVQHQITYCTSTELRDSDGKFLGNIHMVGSPQSAYLALAVIQSDPFVTQEPEIESIAKTMINSLVCECWNQISPGGFDNISQWIAAAKTHHLEAKKITSKSEISGLAQKQILLEITTNNQGYLWKLLVSK